MKNTKKVLFTLAVGISLSFMPETNIGSANSETEQSAFCEGWEEGYKSGWCYEIVNCYEPYVPMCPYPDWGEDHWKGGYNRGFVQGMEDRN